jgi:hypothetical protein
MNSLSSVNFPMYFLVQITKRLLFAKNRSSCRIHTAFKHNNVASNKFHNVNAILQHRQYRGATEITDDRCRNGCRFLILRSVVAWDYQRPSTHTVLSCFLRNFDDVSCNELRTAFIVTFMTILLLSWNNHFYPSSVSSTYIIHMINF